jgi:hypothetical protein
MAGVFIAGHGRMVMGDSTETVPDQVSMGWAVPAQCASTPRVSRNMIAGRNGLLTDVANSGERYNQHWLVPDGAENMILKANDLVHALGGKAGYEGSRNMNAANYWLLQPRGQNAVTLSAILDYLTRKILGNDDIPGNDHIDVMWTCCRSPIGLKGLWSAAIRSPWEAYVLKSRQKDDIIRDPAESDEKFTINRHIVADGVVTLVQASDTSAMLNPNTWVGLETREAPDGVLPAGRMDFLTERKLPD